VFFTNKTPAPTPLPINMHQKIPAPVSTVIEGSTGIVITFSVYTKAGFNRVLMDIVYLLPKNFTRP
jgi:hypothetical protein